MTLLPSRGKSVVDRAERRVFLKQAACAAAIVSAPALALAAQPADEKPKKKADMIWGDLLHLGMNMWCDRDVEHWGNLNAEEVTFVSARPYLRFDENLWKDLTRQMAGAGMNLVVIDLGEGVRYESHPELAVKGSWTPAKLREELAAVRKLGLEPIPKLNFSTTHDAWLGPYSRCVSTPAYYRVCQDLIAEVVALFDKPRFFHLGYDEETAAHQVNYSYAVVRQHELWWHDFLFFVKQVETQGVRPWIWSDYGWHHKDEFFQKMPKSVLQSNWYYGLGFGAKLDPMVHHYLDLEEHGYDQIPTGSNWSTPKNFAATVEFCRQHISPAHLKGFLQTPWKPTVELCRKHHLEAIDQVAQAIAADAAPQHGK